VTSPSDISIKLDGVEVSDRTVYHSTWFESQANPIQGKFQLTIRDPNQDFAPKAGMSVTCHIDGVPMSGGYVFRKGRKHFFDVVDTQNVAPTAVKTRAWVLTGPDYNVLFDKRVVYDEVNFDEALKVPAGSRKLTKALKHLLRNYVDVPAGLDFDSKVRWIDTAYGSEEFGGIYVEQGKTWRDQMEDFADNGGIIYYIDADLALNFHEYEDARVPWLFVDSHPDGVKTIGFREGEYVEDATPMVTDALVWGGSSLAKPGEPIDQSEGIGVVFARYPDPPANDATWHGRLQSKQREQQAIDRQAEFGRWQQAEMKVGQENYLTKGSVKNRAFVIVNGPPGKVPTKGVEGGFNKPVEMMKAAWFAHDVPSSEHLRPGFIQDFILYTHGADAAHPLITTLPLRSMKITFPTLPDKTRNPLSEPKTYVRFDGEFGTNYADSRHLWKYLKRARRSTRREVRAIVSNPQSGGDDVGVVVGSFATLYPNEKPDGSRTEFTFVYTFMTDNLEVYLNGLRQRRDIDFSWDSEGQRLLWTEAPVSSDQIWATGNVSE